jgi:hypothetical protein
VGTRVHGDRHGARIHLHGAVRRRRDSLDLEHVGSMARSGVHSGQEADRKTRKRARDPDREPPWIHLHARYPLDPLPIPDPVERLTRYSSRASIATPPLTEFTNPCPMDG